MNRERLIIIAAVLIAGAQYAYIETQDRLRVEAVYQNPKRVTVMKVRRVTGPVRIVERIIERPSGERETIREEVRGQVVEETDRRDISEPVMHSPHRVFAGAFYDIEKSEARPVVGFSFRNRVDVGIAPVRIERTYKFEFQPTVMIALRF